LSKDAAGRSEQANTRRQSRNHAHGWRLLKLSFL
jgi:hypothetical protein